MSTDDLVAILGDECEFFAGLRYQREAGVNVDALLQGSLARLIMRAGPARQAIGASAATDVNLLDRGGPLTALYQALGDRKSVRGRNGKPGADIAPLLAIAKRCREQINAAQLSSLELIDAMGGKVAPAPAAPARDRTTTIRPPALRPVNGHASGRDGKSRMLAALAAFYPGVMTKAQVAAAGDMTPSGGAFSSAWSALRQETLIVEAGRDLWRCTAAGVAAAGVKPAEQPRTLEARIAFWMARLSTTEQRMLRCIADHSVVTRPQLAELVDMTATGGAFSSAVGTLTRNNLVAKKGPKLVLSSWLKDGPEAAHA